MSNQTDRVIARLFGGLGNQLFIYAAARAVALRNSAELVLDTTSGFESDTLYRRNYQLASFPIAGRVASASERLEPFSRVRRGLLRRVNSRRSFDDRTYLFQEGVDFDPRLNEFELKGTVHLEGYWQSEKYFKEFESKIRRDLSIPIPMDEVNQRTLAAIKKSNAVSVHFRFFDSGDDQSTSNAGSDYYARAIADCEGRLAEPHYFVFSDQPERAAELLQIGPERFTCVTHNRGDAGAISDLFLMSQCTHFVIANSTFSWWGAWLSDQQSKTVIAPSFVKRTGETCWGFDGLLPAEWRLL